ncbi:MAG: NAD-dependent epimerase/dehydratase family protein [Porticoccaceae bacterium]|jgi:nucleoside-diphosphate-sugar epimerase|nr:NAD-dependent epimerase/dehydratase family protein [Porticoccaceae bacterium]
MGERTVVVAGASGFVGGAVVNCLAAAGDCRVVALSRRRPADLPAGVEHRGVDLLDAAACGALARDLTGVTQVVYAAINETPGDLVASWTDPHHAERNGRMLENLLEPLFAAAPGLCQVVAIHGTKAYGPHYPGHIPVPLRESLPRPPFDDFYFRQEDYLRERQARDRQAGRSWHWTTFRAPSIVGGGMGSNLNGLLAIAVFASLRKARGLPLCWPGAVPGDGVMEMVDVELLARGVAWALEAPTARDQTFNIANGDVYIWPDMWPLIAAEIGMPVGEAEACSLVDAVGRDGELWAQLVHRHRLAAPADWRVFLGESCALADFALNNCDRTVLTSTIKLRRAGFSDCVDSGDTVAKWIRRWRDERLIPPA